jgi:hypothetical protein
MAYFAEKYGEYSKLYEFWHRLPDDPAQNFDGQTDGRVFLSAGTLIILSG